MSHLYDTIEPNVTSEALLKQCVLEQGPEGEAGKLAKEEGIDFSEVTQLRLDFQNILRIENLWQFTSLRKLQLDNNIIEDVCGLEHLVQLEWLDLSFNNIELISGLEKLVNLKDLSLANNRIQKVENLSELTGCLQVLSLANNLISDMDNVKYLRQFERLQTVALKGNPLSSEATYRQFVIAYVPSLIYLDFSRIMEEEREESCEMFQELLQEVELHEREMARKKQAQEEEQAQQELYKSGYVDGLLGSALFEALFLDDNDAHRVRHLEGASDMFKQFETEFVQCCEHLVKVGLEEKDKREKEVTSFRTSHRKACLASQQRSADRIKEYETLKQKLLSSGDRRSAVDQITTAIDELHHSLMKFEMQLVEQLDDISKDFELNYGDVVGLFKEQVQSHMTQLRELENKQHEGVTELAINMLERFAKNQLEEDLHEDLRILFVDKDTLMSALNTAHDTHMLVIDNKEDIISQNISKDLRKLLNDIQDAELKRNRRKVVEVDQYIAQQRDDVDALEMTTPHHQ